MSEYVTHGAMLQCSCGTAPGKLNATCNTLWSVQGNMIATTSDKMPLYNIMPFGTCKMKPTFGGFAPCVPAPTVWSNFQDSVELPGGNPLLDRSTIRCVNGGVIEVLHSGQMRHDKVGTNPNSMQIEALKKAAIGAYPFCEECENNEERKNPKITNIYWIDEKSDTPQALSELPEGKEATLCIETDEGGAGKILNLIIDSPEGKAFKGNQPRLEYNSLPVEGDNTAYIDDFKIEYDNKSSEKSDLKATGTIGGLDTVCTLHTVPRELFQVFIRPGGTYDGGYGFDWMRLGLATLDSEDFQVTSEDFESLKEQYETIEITPGVEYHVPWLCMFPNHKTAVGKDVELLFFTDPVKLPTVYEGEEVIRLIPSNEGIIATPDSIKVNDLITGVGVLVKVECASPLSSDGFIELKLEDGGALVGKLNVEKNDHHKKF